MTQDAQIAARIRQGRGPDARLVEAVAAADGVRLGRQGIQAARAALASEVLGLGPLQHWLDDLAVTDVLVNGDGSVWVDRGAGVERAAAEQLDDRTARRLAVRLAGLAGRRLDESQPWVDGLLPGGIRLHAILPPLVEGGVHLSLRVPRARADGLAALRRLGMFGAVTEQLLRQLVRGRTSFVVTGGTGSGKTTLLAALLSEVPATQRIVVVEDVRELAVDHPHVVRLQGRGANVEGQGAVDLVDLVRQALRMRPDRLVVGEVRGAEVREMLAALNTGHDGGCGTLHANSARDVPARFEALGALAGMSRHAVLSQLSSAVQVVVHLQRTAGDAGEDARGGGGVAGGRRVSSLSVLRRVEQEVHACLAFDAARACPGQAWDDFIDLVGGAAGSLEAPGCSQPG
ncbi:TadA family conjugal transfer-associated ATPase [Pedococcus sp. 5OH_020]|uniref:TadA family conjugal transfer-associated ATPase n=1 Tax=Pedococcus sp. 5OH_020 TaxID=2989814 RepID=UPI0022E9A838|nr:TadA family conjugal transfer-associated ATPase [Pedococcus sp. 5OH_020]